MKLPSENLTNPNDSDMLGLVKVTKMIYMPKTLTEAVRYYQDEQTCIDAVAAMRWPDGKPVCPKCGTVFQGATMRAESAMAKDEEAEDEPAAAAVEMVSLDEVEAAEEKAADPVVDDIDVEDDEAAEDTFLEEEEEDEDDVSSLIDGEIAPDEEP